MVAFLLKIRARSFRCGLKVFPSICLNLAKLSNTADRAHELFLWNLSTSFSRFASTRRTQLSFFYIRSTFLRTLLHLILLSGRLHINVYISKCQIIIYHDHSTSLGERRAPRMCLYSGTFSPNHESKKDRLYFLD